MKTKKTIFSAIILSALLMNLTLSAFAQEITGGYAPASTTDKKVVKAAKFAVSNRAKSNTDDKKLKLAKIETAEVQVVAGLNYSLCLAVTNKKVKQFAKAVVYQDLQQKYSLTSWETVEKCDENKASAAFLNYSIEGEADMIKTL